MVTPTSGAISMANMNTEIRRVASTTQISMSEIRTRYGGGAAAINFSDLYKSEGFVITAGTQTDKFGTTEGYSSGFIGSISPDEGGGRLSFAANSWIGDMSQFGGGDTIIALYSNSTTLSTNGTLVTTGFKTTDVTRVVAANTSRSIVSATSDNGTSNLFISYDMPGSGSVHCLMKF